MKQLLYIALLFLEIIPLSGCKNDAQNNTINQSENSKNQTSNAAITKLKEFYTVFYGADKIIINEKNIKNYLTDSLFNKISSLTSDYENLLLDYDPFLQGQDYDIKTLLNSLDIKPLKNKGEFEVSFYLFKNAKKTNVIYQLIETQGEWKINNILSDENFNNKKNNADNGFYELDKTTLVVNKEKYSIVVLEKNEKRNIENVQHNSNPIIIYKENQKIDENRNLVNSYNDNCPADGFQKIVSKGSFFSIEQTNCLDFMFVMSYTTFKINEKGDIYLYKYGEEYIDRSNPDKKIPSNIWTEKDFGKIKFGDVTEEFLNTLIK